MTFSRKGTQHKKSAIMLFSLYAECCDLLIVMLNVIMVSVVMLVLLCLSVVMVNVVAPCKVAQGSLGIVSAASVLSRAI
jgi:hypothetical protein